MAKNAGNSILHVSSLFWDGFEAAQAIADLAQSGFATEDVSAFGTFTGRIPDLDRCLLAMGLSRPNPERLGHRAGGHCWVTGVQRRAPRSIGAGPERDTTRFFRPRKWRGAGVTLRCSFTSPYPSFRTAGRAA